MATIKDVAEKANVSKGTVSNYYSQKRAVSEDTQKRIIRAAEELKYTPNHIARSLVTKQTMTISLNIPFSENLAFSSFHTNLISGVITEAAKQNYRILIDTLSQEDLDLPHVSRDAMDGVILLNPRKVDSRIEYLNKFNIPYVVIGQPSDIYMADAVYVDNNNFDIVHHIVTELITKGHERILFLNASPAMTVSKVREEGLYKAFEDKGLSAEHVQIVYKHDMKEDSSEYGFDQINEHFTTQQQPCTAVIADMDKVALGASNALKNKGFQIPEDVSVVALSDDLVLSKDFDPLLSTVDMRSVDLGSESVKLLFSKIGVGGFKESNSKIIEAVYHRRGSCSEAKR